jgi:hypothetical protein
MDFSQCNETVETVTPTGDRVETEAVTEVVAAASEVMLAVVAEAAAVPLSAALLDGALAPASPRISRSSRV